MTVNPIVKTRGGRNINGSVSRNGVFLRQWAYICPDCPDAKPVIASGYGRASRITRKTAKDALHQHQLRQHRGAPR